MISGTRLEEHASAYAYEILELIDQNPSDLFLSQEEELPQEEELFCSISEDFTEQLAYLNN